MVYLISLNLHSTVVLWIDSIVARFNGAANELVVTVRIVPEEEWT
jgi:hypothetical protein